MADPHTKARQAANQYHSRLLYYPRWVTSANSIHSAQEENLPSKQFIDLEEYGSMEKYFLLLILFPVSYWGRSFMIYDHLTWEFYNVWEAKNILTLTHSICPQLIVTVVFKVNYLWGIVYFVEITRIFLFFPSCLLWEEFHLMGPLCLKLKVCNTITPKPFSL